MNKHQQLLEDPWILNEENISNDLFFFLLKMCHYYPVEIEHNFRTNVLVQMLIEVHYEDDRQFSDKISLRYEYK